MKLKIRRFFKREAEPEFCRLVSQHSIGDQVVRGSIEVTEWTSFSGQFELCPATVLAYVDGATRQHCRFGQESIAERTNQLRRNGGRHDHKESFAMLEHHSEKEITKVSLHFNSHFQA